MKVKRTSTLELGPVLKEENTHKTKRETLHEEATRQLATAANMSRVHAQQARDAMASIQDFATENMDTEIAEMAQQMSDDIDAMVLESFTHSGGGRDLTVDSLFARGQTIEPVERPENLPPDLSVGSMCYVLSEEQVYIYTGERWVACVVETGSNGQVVRATVVHERIDRQN